MQRREFLKWAALSGAATTVPSFGALQASGQDANSKMRRMVSAGLGDKSLRFVVFGDWGSGLSLQKNVARAMSEHCRGAKRAGRNVDFAISVGDNFYNDGVKNPADAQWETKFEAMYPASALPFPFYAVLGNHDWRLDPNAQLQYGAKPGTRWNMGGFYYARSMGGSASRSAQQPLADFFFFDTDLWLPQYHSKGLGDRQTRWLESALNASKARWKILVGHHPPFTDGIHGLEADMSLVREIVVPLCQKYRVDVMFSGHDHDLQRIEVPEVATQFIVCGAGGASLRPRISHNFGPFYRDMVGGFMSIEIDREMLRGEFRGVDGAELHAWSQQPRG